MAENSSIQLTIDFTDPDLDTEGREAEAQNLLNQMRDFDEVEIARVSDPNLPEGNKAFGGFLVGLLTAEVSVENAKKLMGFLGDRLSGKTIEIEVEKSADGKKLKVKASSQAELQAAIEAVQKFIDS